MKGDRIEASEIHKTCHEAIRRTYRDIFFEKIKELCNGDGGVNSRSLQDALGWEDVKFNRIKTQLKEENLIMTSRGGPGGLISLSDVKGEKILSLFISYCRTDEATKNELVKHLEPLKKLNLVSDWHFRQIIPGQDWKEEISNNLENASIILLLISVDFINSDYCYNIEMDRALERHPNRKACISLDYFCRIGAFQWVTANPNKKFLFLGHPVGGHPQLGRFYVPTLNIIA
jgi:hypothetical protein